MNMHQNTLNLRIRVDALPLAGVEVLDDDGIVVEVFVLARCRHGADSRCRIADVVLQ